MKLNAAARLEAAPKLFLWVHNTATGVWNQCRDVTSETQGEWLKIFQKDQPHARFMVSERKPKPVPNQPGERM